MAFEHDGVVYKSKRAFYKAMHPNCDIESVSQNDIDRFIYHNVPSYREKRVTFYRERYRKNKQEVRCYTKYCCFAEQLFPKEN